MKIIYSVISNGMQLITVDEDFSKMNLIGKALLINNQEYKNFHPPLGVPYGHDLVIYEDKVNLMGKSLEFI